MSRLLLAAVALAILCALVAPVALVVPGWWGLVPVLALGAASLACSTVQGVLVWRQDRRGAAGDLEKLAAKGTDQQ